jgi:hypothetical protein
MSEGPVSNWQPWHSVALIAVVVFFVWMAVRLPWGLYPSWIVVMITLTAFTLVVGRGVTGVWKGVFVDERLRMSLSRVQMSAWTIVIVAAFGTIAIARVQNDAATAMDIGVPETVWLLLGITTTSLIGSPLIRNAKKNTPINKVRALALIEHQKVGPNAVTHDGQVVKNRSIDEASFADLFMGENVDNFTLFDVGKLQMFFFTVLSVLAYAVAIGQSLRAPDLPTALPDVGSGMLPILGISHAGYLMSKAAASPGEDDTETTDDVPAADRRTADPSTITVTTETHVKDGGNG